MELKKELTKEEKEELLKKLKQAENAEKLLALAKENGLEMTSEEAEKAFTQLHNTGELSDDELDDVSGGFLFFFF